MSRGRATLGAARRSTLDGTHTHGEDEYMCVRFRWSPSSRSCALRAKCSVSWSLRESNLGAIGAVRKLMCSLMCQSCRDSEGRCYNIVSIMMEGFGREM